MRLGWMELAAFAPGRAVIPLIAAVGCDQPGVAPPLIPVPAPPANVLIILLDDTGQDKISVYDRVADTPATPNIDALAETGMRFTQAWAYPMCSPTRAAMLTGQHTRRYGIGNRLTPNVEEWELVPEEVVSLPEMLLDAPDLWDTSFLGKWHLSSGNLGDDPLNHPLHHGFGWSEGSLANLYAAVTNDVAGPDRNYFSWEEIRNGEASWKETYATTEVVDDALARAAAMHEPWLMWVAVPSIHVPLHVPPPDLYDGPEPITDRELVDAMVVAMDAEIGRLLDGLDPELKARTNIVLLGDNGTENEGIAPPLDPNRDKGTVYEGGVRVPLIVSGPAVAEAGSVSDAMVHVVDLFPTVAELARVDTSELLLDGRSWVEVLDDPSLPGADLLYSEYFGPNGPGPYTYSTAGVRSHDYKYIRMLNGTEELYAVGPDALDEGPNLLLEPDALSEAASEAWADLSQVLDELFAEL